MAYLPSLLRGLAVLLLAASLAPAQAAVRNVPSAAYPTIQAGVDAASDGDILLVADGIYSGPGNRDIDFHGKSLTVKSMHGPAKTIINCGGYKSKDGSGNHRGFYLHSGEKAAAISGFTIKNGCEIVISSPVPPNSPNVSPGFDHGGGVEFSDFFSAEPNGTLLLSDCIVSGNIAGIGGGVYNENGYNRNGYGKHGGTIILTRCIVSGNTAQVIPGLTSLSEGGGVYNRNSNGGSILLIDCTISENSAPASSDLDAEGGGVYNENSNDQTSGEKNVVEGGTITLTGCTISKNHVFRKNGYGGGINNENVTGFGAITLTNCVVSGNTCDTYGGGIYNGSAINADGGTVTLANCTVCGNAASLGGSGMYDSYFLYKGSAITLTNCLFFGDKGGEIANDYAQTASDYIALHAIDSKLKLRPAPPMKIKFTFSDIQGGLPGTGNINADPLFEDASAGDFRLKPGSPCLGKGTPQNAPSADKNGSIRPNPPSMGAYERIKP